MNLQDLWEGLQQDTEAPTVRMPVRDSIATARGYRMIDEAWTCVPDAMYPWDPTALKLIQQFAPDTVPLWRLSVFLEPNTTKMVVFGRHALGRYIDRPEYELTPFRVHMPTMPCQGITFPRPNKVWFVHEGNRNPDYPDIPGTYLPFDSSIVDRAWQSTRNYSTMSDREFKRAMVRDMIGTPFEEREARRAALQDDWEQRDKDFHPYANKLIDRVSDVEIEEFMASVGKRDRVRKPWVG